SLVQPKTVPLARAPSAFRSHKKKNMLLLSLIVLAVMGVSIVAVEFVAANTLRMHIHPQLSITLNGSPVQVPAQIRNEPSLWKDHSLDQYGLSGLAPINTPDPRGLINFASK